MFAEQLHPLVQAELSVLVDILYHPDELFVPSSVGHNRCTDGRFMYK